MQPPVLARDSPLRRLRARCRGVRAAPPGAPGQARAAADGPPDPAGREPPSARLPQRHRRSAVGQGRVRGRRDRRQHRDQQGQAGSARFAGRPGVRGDGSGQGVSLHRGRRGGLRAPPDVRQPELRPPRTVPDQPDIRALRRSERTAGRRAVAVHALRVPASRRIDACVLRLAWSSSPMVTGLVAWTWLRGGAPAHG